MNKVYAKQVIICTKGRRGVGVEHSPIRVITEIFDMNGELLADNDPLGNITPESILDFLRWHYNDISEIEHKKRLHAYYIEDANDN